MKQNYENAEMEIVAFEAEDIIATSRGLNHEEIGSGETYPWPF